MTYTIYEIKELLQKDKVLKRIVDETIENYEKRSKTKFLINYTDSVDKEEYSEIKYYKSLKELQDYLDSEAYRKIIKSIIINPKNAIRCIDCGEIISVGISPCYWGICPDCMEE